MSGMAGTTPDQAYRKALYIGWTQELEDVIINSGDPKWAYNFARDIEGANIPKLEQIVIDSGDCWWAYWFALYIPEANISDLIDFVLINDLDLIRRLFDEKPNLKHKYELGEIRKQIRGILR